MAGTFGLKRKNYRTSLRPDWGLISACAIRLSGRHDRVQHLQIANGARHHKATIHPLKLLALAYGLMPEAAELFAARSEELVVT